MRWLAAAPRPPPLLSPACASALAEQRAGHGRPSNAGRQPRLQRRQGARRERCTDAQREQGRRQLGGRLLRRRQRGRPGHRRSEHRASARVLDRLPGGLENGPRLLRRLRPQAQRSLRLPAPLRDLPARSGSTGAAAGASPTSTSSSCSASASPTSSSTEPKSASRSRSSTSRSSTSSAGRCGSACVGGGRGSGQPGPPPGC